MDEDYLLIPDYRSFVKKAVEKIKDAQSTAEYFKSIYTRYKDHNPRFIALVKAIIDEFNLLYENDKSDRDEKIIILEEVTGDETPFPWAPSVLLTKSSLAILNE